MRLLGDSSLRMLAIGSEQQEFARGAVLFRQGDAADCGYVVLNGSFRISDDDHPDQNLTAGPGTLLGELTLLLPMQRPATAVATEFSSVIRITRSLFQRVLDSDPDAALRLRDEIATRVNRLSGDVTRVGAKLSQ